MQGDDDPTDAREFVRDIRSGLSSDEVGSVWLDNGTIVVSVTARASARGTDVDKKAQLHRIKNFRVAKADVSQGDIERLRSALEASKVATLAQGVLAFGTDSSSGQLRLSVTAAKGRLESVRSHVLSALGQVKISTDAPLLQALVVFGEGEVGQTELRDSAPTDSGDWIISKNINGKPWTGVCTFGWVLVRPGGFAGATAGHCYGPGVTTCACLDNGMYFANLSQASTGQRITPGVGTNTYGSGGPDVLGFWLLDSLPAATPRVNVSGVGWRTARGKTLKPDLIFGVSVCWSGFGLQKNAGVGERCGTVRLSEVQLNFPDGVAKHLYCNYGQNYAGDSGGPVYWRWPNGNAEPTGIVSGSWSSLGSNFNCFTPIWDVEASTGYQVWTT